jgi:hypothetical protein
MSISLNRFPHSGPRSGRRSWPSPGVRRAHSRAGWASPSRIRACRCQASRCFRWSAGYTQLEEAHGRGHPGLGSAVRNGTLRRRLMCVPRLSVSDRGRLGATEATLAGSLAGSGTHLTVARAGFHSSIYLRPTGRLVQTGSVGLERPGRGCGWTQLDHDHDHTQAWRPLHTWHAASGRLTLRQSAPIPSGK